MDCPGEVWPWTGWVGAGGRWPKGRGRGKERLGPWGRSQDERPVEGRSHRERPRVSRLPVDGIVMRRAFHHWMTLKARFPGHSAELPVTP